MTLVAAPSKSQFAYQRLKDRIAQQEYSPGYRLVLAALADEFEMSTVPVREAIRQLEAEGLVTFERNVGARVVKVGDSRYRHTVQTITILESAATALAAGSLTAHDLGRARAINDLMADSLDQFEPRSFSVLNQQFHRTLYGKCANPRLLELLDIEWGRLGHLRDSTFAFKLDRARESVREHEQIVAQIERGAPLDQIEAIVRRHRNATLNAYRNGPSESTLTPNES